MGLGKITLEDLSQEERAVDDQSARTLGLALFISCWLLLVNLQNENPSVEIFVLACRLPQGQ
jgi:hypothetical protein